MFRAGSSISVIANTLTSNPAASSSSSSSTTRPSTVAGDNKIPWKSTNLTSLKEVSNNRSSTSINFRLTTPSTKSIPPPQQQIPTNQINKTSQNSGSNSRKKRERVLRTNTASSTSTSASAVSALSSPTIPDSPPTSSIGYPSPRSAEQSPPTITTQNNQYFPDRPSIDVVTSTTSSVLNSEDTTSRSARRSMRRRATDTIGNNLLSSSIRAVFRDNSAHRTLAPTNTSEAGDTTEQISTSLPRSSHTSRISRPSITRSATTAATPQQNPSISIQSADKQPNGNATEMPSIKFIPHQDQRNSRPSLAFAPMTRTLPEDDSIIRVGRYSERDISPNANNSPSAAPIGFKSKVVSRRHCEFWFVNGQWYVKDVKSSSGTFLNHIRLSQPSTESKPFPINDGDIIQLGMDFRGGEESIFRCVKIRIEVNRGWQKKLNEYNTTTHKALRALSKETGPTSSTECSICLMSVAPCQALFVAPCSHVWHYKCIRPVINNPKMYPQFLCPNCRAVADLDADIEENVDGWDEIDELTGNEGLAGAESVDRRVATPVNGHRTGDDSGSVIMEITTPPQISINRSSNSGVSAEELQDTSAILFAETSRIELRDPRTVADSLEGVVTPRNEAGPFVFD